MVPVVDHCLHHTNDCWQWSTAGSGLLPAVGSGGVNIKLLI